MQAYMEERASEFGLIMVTGINMIKEHKQISPDDLKV